MEKFITAMKSLNNQLSNTLIATSTRESNKNSAGKVQLSTGLMP